jgi:hypothetical protein
MLDNTLLVFTSDCAETQHTSGANWPFAMVGTLGGSIKAGQYLSYPLGAHGGGNKPQGDIPIRQIDTRSDQTNPAINALYCSLLHAAGKPRDAFNGGSIANNAFGQADDLSFSLVTDGGSRPNLEFELSWAHGTAPTANTALTVYAQDLNFNGTPDAQAPSANNLRRFVASVNVANTTSTQYARFDVMFAPADAAYWLLNTGTGQTVSAGWTLRARAWTLKAA